jgi:hypothetical protein
MKLLSKFHVLYLTILNFHQPFIPCKTFKVYPRPVFSAVYLVYLVYFENRKLVRGCTPEVIPYLLTGSKSVVGNWIFWARCWNRKLFRSWKPDIVNRKLKTEFVNRKCSHSTKIKIKNSHFRYSTVDFRYTTSITSGSQPWTITSGLRIRFSTSGSHKS